MSENEARTITFTDRSYTLTIEVQEQLFPEERNDWDEKAYSATITLRATTSRATFRGSVKTHVMTYDIAALVKALKEVNAQVGKEATVTFGIYEAYLDIQFSLTKTGQMALLATLVDDPVATATLTVQIEVDQSYLPTWISKVEDVLRQMEAQR
jgi:hypothetical protein